MRPPPPAPATPPGRPFRISSAREMNDPPFQSRATLPPSPASYTRDATAGDRRVCPAFPAGTASALQPSRGGPLVSFPAAWAGATENQRTPSLERHPVDAVPRPVKSFVPPWTCLPPTTASLEPPPQPLAPRPRRSPQVPRACQEPAAAPPCRETGTVVSLRPHLPIPPPTSP